MPIIPAFLQRKNPRFKTIILLVITLLLLFFIVQGVRLLIPEERSIDAPYWYDKYPSIKLTSYENESYGTFFSSTQVRVAYTHSSILKELKKKETILLNTIVQVISEQNYYKINTDEKRRANLTPILKKEMNQVLGIPNAIVDLEYSAFLIEASKWNLNSTEYFGELSLDFKTKKNHYHILYYVIHDSMVPLFNKFLKRKQNDLESFVQNKLISKKVDEVLGDFLMEENLETLISEAVTEYFEILEKEIQTKHPLYIPSQKFQSTFLSLFKSQ